MVPKYTANLFSAFLEFYVSIDTDRPPNLFLPVARIVLAAVPFRVWGVHRFLRRPVSCPPEVDSGQNICPTMVNKDGCVALVGAGALAIEDVRYSNTE